MRPQYNGWMRIECLTAVEFVVFVLVLRCLNDCLMTFMHAIEKPIAKNTVDGSLILVGVDILSE